MKIFPSGKLNYIFYLVAVLIIILVGFNIFFTFQFHKQIVHVVDNPGRWPAGAYEYDPVIGFDFASNISAPIKDGSFYVKSHDLGYRIGKTGDALAFQPGGVLSLGCSFTYGDEVEAEQTFTQLIADSLGVGAYNYGICSFSYIHALLKAKKLKDQGVLDRLMPQYVVLGCWHGLVDRSRSPYPPVLSERIPLIAAHIVKDDHGVQVASPSNIDHAFDLINLYRKEGTGMSANKFFKIFLLAPRFLILSMTHDPGTGETEYNEDVSDFEVYDHYFTAVKEIFAPYGSRIIVLYMPNLQFDVPGKALTDAIAKHNAIFLVDGLNAIKKYDIPVSDYVNKHPRPPAHKAYAWESIRVIYEFDNN